jgi:hypothetical protein
VKAIKIDSHARTVTEVEREIAPRDSRAVLRFLYDNLNCDCVCTVTLSHWPSGVPRETLWVDDEGLLKRPSHFFIYRPYPQPLAGNGMILGTTHGGYSVSTDMKLEDVIKCVSFTRGMVEI